MVDHVFPHNSFTQDGSNEIYPVKRCCVSDDLSGDMLAPSWPNLVLLYLHFRMPTKKCCNKVLQQKRDGSFCVQISHWGKRQRWWKKG